LQHLSWSSTGTATGPYPGTYLETGTIGGDPSHVTEFKSTRSG
jgi:hypothetical protein